MAKKREQPKQAQALASWEALKPEPIQVVIAGDDEQNFIIEMNTLSYARWEQIAADFPKPTPPFIGVDANKRPQYDWQDAGYIEQLNLRAEKIAFARLLEMLTLPVPGETREAQITYLMGLDKKYSQLLIKAMTEISGGGEARIEERARTF